VEFVGQAGEEVEFLKKGDYFLRENDGGFLLATKPDYISLIPIRRPKLIPCLEKDVKVGEWMVMRGFKADAQYYLLRTKDGFVGFTDDDYQPFRFSNVESPETEVYKVQF
jgi:hypothetical protein